MYMSLVRDVRKNRAAYVTRLVAWEERGGWRSWSSLIQGGEEVL